MDNRSHLGDGVYADWDGFGVTTYTDRDGGQRHWIYWEPEVLDALVRYYERMSAKQEA